MTMGKRKVTFQPKSETLEIKEPQPTCPCYICGRNKERRIVLGTVTEAMKVKYGLTQEVGTELVRCDSVDCRKATAQSFVSGKHVTHHFNSNKILLGTVLTSSTKPTGRRGRPKKAI